MKKEYPFEHSDAWLLLGILYASNYGKNYTDLQMIIGCCDYIEHAIITFEEMNGGLFRLIQNQHIHDNGKMEFIPTENIINKYKEYVGNKKRTYALKDLEFIINLINAKKWEPNFNFKKANESFKYKNLNPEMIMNAYKRYAKIK